MTRALVLVDCQRDFLALPGLSPAAPLVVANARRLLEACRSARMPIVHVLTSVNEANGEKLPHWKRNGIRRCVVGTPGHAPPAELSPRDGEAVVHKLFYSGFSSPELESRLRDDGVRGIVLGGTMLHACVRETALGAWERGFEVWLATDAVASDDPLHAAATQTWFEERLEFTGSVDEIVARLSAPEQSETGARAGVARRAPANRERALEPVPETADADIARAVDAARRAGFDWRRATAAARREVFETWANGIRDTRAALVEALVVEVGKPLRDARAEVTRAEELVRAAGAVADEVPKLAEPGAFSRRVPLGVVGIITPWNNPLAIPAGKLAPALAFGNAVVWKPALHGFGLARALAELFARAGAPPGLLGFVPGGDRTARALLGAAGIDAVSVTGSESTGRIAQRFAATRFLPLQAELGGNNASIVWEPEDLAGAFAAVARGAFGFAGQRCTANRRVIVPESLLERAVAMLEAEASALVVGEPELETTDVGPVISDRAALRIEGVLARARASGLPLSSPAAGTQRFAELAAKGSYVAPALVVARDPSHELVTEETFGPVLVIQPAKTFDDALTLAGAVRQGLVLSLFAREPRLRSEFLERARAGVLKLDVSTAAAGVHAPFGGFGASGIGPPEHGDGDREFYTRLQAVYATRLD